MWKFLRELKIELPYDPAIPLLGIYSDKTIIRKDTCALMFIATLFTIVKTWKQPQLRYTLNIPGKRKMDKEAVVIMYNGISLSHEINVIRLVAA